MSLADPRLWTTLVIVAAVGTGVVKTLLWQRSAPAEARAPLWRIRAPKGAQPP